MGDGAHLLTFHRHAGVMLFVLPRIRPPQHLESGQQVDDRRGAAQSGVKDNSHKKFAKCAKELAEQGFEYSERTLRDLRDLAAHFPSARRHAPASLDAHKIATSPDNLDRAIEMLEKANKLVTQINVIMVMKAWRQKDKAERGDAFADASRSKRNASPSGGNVAKQNGNTRATWER